MLTIDQIFLLENSSLDSPLMRSEAEIFSSTSDVIVDPQTFEAFKTN
jgi:hypothetical protein